ncbi:MAG TPA: hypothetical protein VKU19_36670 [Bryobacteraceae bacterium]|nr:hypothetical protein [Bryobacteraceae bacterium]
MRSSHKIAAWMLERISVDPALAGDLLEEARKRGSVWYWRQVLIAVCTGIWTAIVDHKLLIALGYAVDSLLWVFLCGPALQRLVEHKPSLSFISWTATLSMVFFSEFVTGWILARIHRAHAMLMVFAFMVWLALWYLGTNYSEIARLIANSIDQPRFRVYLTWYLTIFSAEISGVLAGGLIGSRSRKIANASR